MANIKDKIAKLLALAESPNEAEAKAALLKARELMAKNKLTPEECQKQKNQKVVKDFTDIQCTAMTNPWAASLSAVIADNYCCRAINRKRKGYRDGLKFDPNSRLEGGPERAQLASCR